MAKIISLVAPEKCDPFEDPLEEVALHLGRRFGYNQDRAFKVAKRIRHLRLDYRDAFYDCWHERDCRRTISLQGHQFYVPNILKQCGNFIDAFMAVEESQHMLCPAVNEPEKW